MMEAIDPERETGKKTEIPVTRPNFGSSMPRLFAESVDRPVYVIAASARRGSAAIPALKPSGQSTG